MTMMVYYRSPCNYGYVIVYAWYTELGGYSYFCGTHDSYGLIVSRRFAYIKYVPGSYLYWLIYNGFSYAEYTAKGWFITIGYVQQHYMP